MELIVVVALSTIVLMPMFLLVNHTLERQKPRSRPTRPPPTCAPSGRSCWRTGAPRRWRRVGLNAAEPILLTPETTGGEKRADCHGGTYPYYASTYNVTAGIIALHTTVRASGQTTNQRVVYSRVNRPDGLIDIVRRECAHSPQDIGGEDYWADFSTSSYSVTATTGSERVVASGLKEIRTPTTCNSNSVTDPPYEQCDINLTIVGADGQTSTVRLYQRTGKNS